MAGGRRHHDEICCGVAAAGVSDGDGAVPEIDGCIVDPVLRWFQGRDRAVWYREAMGGPGPGCLVSAAAKQLYSRIPVSNNVLWNLQ